MRNLRLEIEYDGTNYCGWQIQSSLQKKSIQETIEGVLAKILQEKVCLIASGRTDAGVHALGQVANFKTSSKINLSRLQVALNSLLPKDIAISAIKEAPLVFHSRFSAKSKIYRYLILNRPYPCAFLRDRAFFCPYPLDVQLMRKCSKALLGRHDFKSFCASGSRVKDTICTIKRIKIGTAPIFIAIEIEADGFLYNMVRNIVGTLIEIGRGRAGEFDLKNILQSKDRRLAGPTAQAKGLYLIKVKY